MITRVNATIRGFEDRIDTRYYYRSLLYFQHEYIIHNFYNIRCSNQSLLSILMTYREHIYMIAQFSYTMQYYTLRNY